MSTSDQSQDIRQLDEHERDPLSVRVERPYLSYSTDKLTVACFDNGKNLYRRAVFTGFSDTLVEVFIPATREIVKFRKSTGHQTVHVLRRKYRIKPF